MKKVAMMTLMGVLLASPAAFAEEGAAGEGRHGGRGGMMKAADADGDGNISKAEFLAMSEKHFAKMDKNGDGVISADERPDPSKFKGRRGGGMQGGGGAGDGVPAIPAE